MGDLRLHVRTAPHDKGAFDDDLASAVMSSAYGCGCPPPFDRPKEDGMANTEQSSDIATDPALVRAMGGALAVFATLIARKGIAPLDGIPKLLGIYALVSAEAAPDEG